MREKRVAQNYSRARTENILFALSVIVSKYILKSQLYVPRITDQQKWHQINNEFNFEVAQLMKQHEWQIYWTNTGIEW